MRKELFQHSKKMFQNFYNDFTPRKRFETAFMFRKEFSKLETVKKTLLGHENGINRFPQLNHAQKTQPQPL